MTIVNYDGEAIIGHIFPTKFVSKWDTTQPGSANDTIVLPLVADGTYDFYIDWGDGSRDTITGYDQSEVTHQYSDTGIYTIQLVANDMVGWQFNDSGDDDKLVEIMDWGPLRFVSDDTNLFKGCSNLTLSTTSDPPFNADAAGMFQDCSSLTGTGGNILNWDMSAVTGMNFMLAGCTNLDPDLSNWNVSAIENAEGFMSGAGLSTMNYDRILSGWSLQAVQSGVTISFGDTKYSEATGAVFRNLLTSAETGWNISDGGMILLPIPHFISTWDTRLNMFGINDSKVILPLRANGTYDFYVDWGDGTPDQHVNNYNSSNGAHTYTTPGIYTVTITGTLSGWTYDTTTTGPNGGYRSDLNHTKLQHYARKLRSIHDWECLQFVPNARYHFVYSDFMTGIPTTVFNGSSAWGAFASLTGLADAFNNNVATGWDTSSLTDISSMLSMVGYNAPTDFDVSNWDVSNVTGMASCFHNTRGWNNGGSSSISGWDTSSAMDISFIFSSCDSFNQDIGAWDTSNVTNMDGPFYNATNFNNGGSSSISGWDTSNVERIRYIFRGSSFDQPVGYWNTSKLQMMDEAFRFRNYSYDLANWVVTGVTSATNFLGSPSRGMSTANYDATLIGWGAQSVQNGVNIYFGNSKYSFGTAASARQSLVNQGWTITDGGHA